ncbi:MAG: M55 family metallopeptidase [Planctomycetes bacterium]|nr:M55 family metallopeptidase [Planctomycetota bacterium]
MAGTEVYILCDMEGITGAVSYQMDVFPNAPNYSKARRWLTDDLEAAMQGAHEAGADHFTVYDMHFHGANVMADHLHLPCTIIRGKPLVSGMRRGIKGMFMIGLHAMAGTERGVLPHTYNHEIERIELNGMAVGEIGIEAAAAGSYGIPLLLVVGDEEGCEEARTLLGPIETVAVKWLDDHRKVVLKSDEEARQEIFDAAQRAVARTSKQKPLRISGRCELRIACKDASFRDKLHEKCGGEPEGSDSLILQGPDMRTVYEQFRKSQVRTA